MKTKLITALRAAAKAIESGTFYYEWSEKACCNCGSLFCALTGKSAAELKEAIPEPIFVNEIVPWETLIGQHCPVTGMPTQKLFRELFGYGLNQNDIINLEYLSAPKVISRMNTFESVVEEIPVRRKWYQFRQPNTTAIVKNVRVKILDYTNKKHVIAYMRAWAEILTEEGSMDCHSYEQESTETSQAQLTHTNKQSNENQIQTTNAQ